MQQDPPSPSAPTNEDTPYAVRFAESAMASAQHQITDPVLRELVLRVARGELTAAEACQVGEAHLGAE